MHARAGEKKEKKKEKYKMGWSVMVNREKGNLVVSFVYSLWRGLLVSTSGWGKVYCGSRWPIGVSVVLGS